MSEERTQAPTRQRRKQARERGLVARSPELTAAVGLFAAVVLLAAQGGHLTGALTALFREPLVGDPLVTADLASVVARVRSAAWQVFGPLSLITGGATLAMLAAHQVPRCCTSIGATTCSWKALSTAVA